MARETDERSQFYCNYCGEPLLVGVRMSDHMRARHADEVHYDPGRKKKSIAIGVAGTVIIVLGTVLTAAFFGAEMGEDGTTLLVIAALSLALALYLGCALHESRGMKAGDEVLMDLLVDCDVCGMRVQFRDLESHVACHHPEEDAAEKKVDNPIQWTAIFLLGAGFVGFAAFYVASLFADVIDTTLFILISASVVAAGAGTALIILHGELIYRPRTRRLAREWDERHPGSRKE